ncbi:MAG: hypothetical protein IJ749_03540 [Eubacterium sp.]|nr:hypothetical protein [Eubacterium sp.]
MKSTMTECDKKLLVGMFIGVIIVAIGYWGILPQIRAYNSISDKIEKEENKKKINELKLLNVGTIQIQADDYESRIAEKKDEFFQILSSSEVDRMMTEMATDNNLDIYELNFNMPSSPSDRLAYKNSQLYNIQLQQMADYESSAESMETEADENDPSLGGEGESASTKTPEEINAEVFGEEEGSYRPNTDIYAVPVTMTVGGELDDLESFIDDIINSDKRILMVGYSWGEYRNLVRRGSEENVAESVEADTTGVSTEEIDGAVVEVVTKKSLTVKLEIFMCDTSDVASSGDAIEE